MNAPSVRLFSETERALLLGVQNAGPKMVGFLELAGVSSLSELARADAALLRIRINAHLGHPHLNTMGQDVLSAMIAAARAELNR
jgi:hypothetical protein